MGRLGSTEILLIIFVILLFFGGKKIPDLMKGLGNGLREFKKASSENENKDDVKKENNI
ncbi:twin-arginine translocase TatA/TatE family subunit [Flavobacterium chilense]|uniref:Sec-independent protein translocase protein TatA n=1 Tax=Flavobacterium chilense TaxID=946677 RepID=A0A1M7E1Q2_9FLAO|nr:twin-arginine translocase TatA/TatE family subunit [Flavobacterium chilense]SHL85662.1 sec-independent protein translocase protein TatA [Flavobacterium chilense]